jgi:prepilin-type processing-associated H-X9-DG protein
VPNIGWPYGETAYPSDCWFLGKYTDNVWWDPLHVPLPFTNGYVTTSSVWHCPEDNAAISMQASGVTVNANDNSRPVSYAMNSWNGIVNSTTGYYTVYPAIPAVFISTTSGLNNQPQYPTGWERCIKMTQIVSPSRCMAFVDSCGSVLNQGGMTGSTLATSYQLFGNPNGDNTKLGGTPDSPGYENIHAIRHPKMSTNMSFFDGHVENFEETYYTENGWTGWGLHDAYVAGGFAFSYRDP